jgi:hypothetical protein
LQPWLTGDVEAFETHWDKPVQEFVVSWEWAFERYAYTSTDKPRGGGDAIQGTGWGGWRSITSTRAASVVSHVIPGDRTNPRNKARATERAESFKRHYQRGKSCC